MAPLEAAACGVPIVGTAVGVLPELCPDAARTVERGDWHALAQALSRLLGDPDRQAAMGCGGPTAGRGRLHRRAVRRPVSGLLRAAPLVRRLAFCSLAADP